MSDIVVGVDGSASSQQALAWALDEARHRDAPVRVVHAWDFPYTQGEIAHQAGQAIRAPLQHDAHHIIDMALRNVGGLGDNVDVRRVVTRGAPVAVLVQAARNAQLLVVGTRGRGAFAGLLLGSVSQECAQRAPCPVVIVRGAHHP